MDQHHTVSAVEIAQAVELLDRLIAAKTDELADLHQIRTLLVGNAEPRFSPEFLNKKIEEANDLGGEIRLPGADLISSLQLPRSTARQLWWGGIWNTAQLTELTEAELRFRVRGLQMPRLKRRLAEHGLSLRQA